MSDLNAKALRNVFRYNSKWSDCKQISEILGLSMPAKRCRIRKRRHFWVLTLLPYQVSIIDMEYQNLRIEAYRIAGLSDEEFHEYAQGVVIDGLR